MGPDNTGYKRVRYFSLGQSLGQSLQEAINQAQQSRQEARYHGQSRRKPNMTDSLKRKLADSFIPCDKRKSIKTEVEKVKRKIFNISLYLK